MMFNSTLLIVQLLHSVLKTHPAEAAIAIIHYLKLVNSSLSLFFFIPQMTLASHVTVWVGGKKSTLIREALTFSNLSVRGIRG